MNIQSVEEVKARLGRTATFAWLGGGAILLLAEGDFATLFSLRTLVFLGIGMFVAAFLVGLASYKLFLKLSDKAAISANAGEARDAVLRSFRQSQIAAIVLSLIFVLWVYASFYRY